MTAETELAQRIATLDIVRGVAVMGILAMNIVAFAMPLEAYMNPAAYGAQGTADLISWAFSFVLVDGKMRGLFSFLFGASILLVIDRAAARGEDSGSVHFRRMIWLLFFGCLHFYFVWFGDILVSYALVGMLGWFFYGKEPRSLIAWGVALVIIQFLLFAAMAAAYHVVGAAVAAPNPDPQMVKAWAEMQRGFGVPTAAQLQEALSLYRGTWPDLVHHQLTKKSAEPFMMVFIYGWETLAYMLFGMAALKNGFLTGSWENARYRKIALIGFGLGIPAYAALAAMLWSDGFTVPLLVTVVMAGTVLLRPLMVVATAALIILLTRKGGALVHRIAAAGRAAFTNYLGTSILMTFLFYGWGLGQFGMFSRSELWLVVIGIWALMLLWSKPWLERHLYGPFEWLWRTLARGEVQPMRKPAVAAAE
jgi:uncharacterized protein